MRHITFVRHAESIGNIKNLETEGAKHDKLTEQGNEQAVQFAQNFKGVPSLIVSSSCVRAKETAQPLINKFPEARHEEWGHIHEFSYLKKCTEIEEKNRRRKIFWSKQDPTFRDCEYTESFSELIARVDKTLEKVARIKDSSVVIFSHAKFMRTMILRLIHSKTVDHVDLMRMLTTYSFRFGHCDVLEICVDEKGCLYLKEL